MKTSLWFYPNQQKQSAKIGKVPLYVRVIQNAKKSEGRLYNAELTEKEVLQWNERAMRLSDLKHKAIKSINAVQRDFEELLILNGKNINQHSAINIRDHLMGRNKVEAPSVTAYIDNFFATAIDCLAKVRDSRNVSMGVLP